MQCWCLIDIAIVGIVHNSYYCDIAISIKHQHYSIGMDVKHSKVQSTKSMNSGDTSSDDSSKWIPFVEDISSSAKDKDNPDIDHVSKEGNETHSDDNVQEEVESTEIQKRRKYTYRNRLPRAPLSNLRKARWVDLLQSMTVSKLRRTFCCKSLRCFRHVNYDFYMEHAKIILSSTAETRRAVLKSFLSSDRSFLFDGRVVCVRFLREGFHFSTVLKA